jgi:hypothetical protein
MGVPVLEVSYTSATTGRGDQEVHKGHVVALGKKILFVWLSAWGGGPTSMTVRAHLTSQALQLLLNGSSRGLEKFHADRLQKFSCSVVTVTVIN